MIRHIFPKGIRRRRGFAIGSSLPTSISLLFLFSLIKLGRFRSCHRDTITYLYQYLNLIRAYTPNNDLPIRTGSHIIKRTFLSDRFSFSYYGDVGHGHERIALNSAFLSHVPKFDGYIVVSHEAFLSTHEIHIFVVSYKVFKRETTCSKLYFLFSSTTLVKRTY